jgi:hypothetical protein
VSGSLSTKAILTATKAELVAMTWPASTDKVFNHVVAAPYFNIEAVTRLARQCPAAIVVPGGEQYDPENEEFSQTSISVIIVHRDPHDQFDEAGVMNNRGLLDIIDRVRTLISYYNTHFGAESWWASTSASLPLKRADDPGGFVAIEVKFEIRHMTIAE